MSGSSAEPSTNFGSTSDCIEPKFKPIGNGHTDHHLNEIERIACDVGDGEGSGISHYGLGLSSTSTVFFGTNQRFLAHKQLTSRNDVHNENNNNETDSQIYEASDTHTLPVIQRPHNSRAVSSNNNRSSSLSNTVVVEKNHKRSNEQMGYVSIRPQKRLKAADDDTAFLGGVARGEEGNLKELEEKMRRLDIASKMVSCVCTCTCLYVHVYTNHSIITFITGTASDAGRIIISNVYQQKFEE